MAWPVQAAYSTGRSRHWPEKQTPTRPTGSSSNAHLELRPHAAYDEPILLQLSRSALAAVQRSPFLSRHFVARGLDRPGAHPPPHQHDVLVRGIVEAVPAGPG